VKKIFYIISESLIFWEMRDTGFWFGKFFFIKGQYYGEKGTRKTKSLPFEVVLILNEFFML